MSASVWEPMDLMKHRTGTDGQVIPLHILMLRDWGQPAWIACNLDSGQLTRIWDGIDDKFYTNLGPFNPQGKKKTHPGSTNSMSHPTIVAAIRRAHW